MERFDVHYIGVSVMDGIRNEVIRQRCGNRWSIMENATVFRNSMNTFKRWIKEDVLDKIIYGEELTRVKERGTRKRR